MTKEEIVTEEIVTKSDTVTIVEKYQQSKNHTIAIRPYFDETKENMGLEKYKMTLFDGVYHHQSLTCLEQNGVSRYLTGLNEFAPEVKTLSPEARKEKIKEIRNTVSELEKQLATNVIDIDDKDFWGKVQILRPDNHKFWDKISIKCGNDPIYLDPIKDPYDLIKIYGIEAGGFSIIGKTLAEAKQKGLRFYLDKVQETTSTRTQLSKIRNKALAALQGMYDSDTSKLFYVTKVVDPNSTQYEKTTPIDILYENMDAYINGNSFEKGKKKAAQHFLSINNLSMEDLKIRALVKDAMLHGFMESKSDGYIYDSFAKVKLGKRSAEVVEFLKNPINDDTLNYYLEKIEPLWNK